MSDTRRVIRVFLASPGDLSDERIAIRDVAKEFNDTWADKLGYQVELIGWEDTVAVYGRPQEIINHDLDRCELFIGLMWKKWGTPPDTSGEYTSGFHEEFERSIERRKTDGRPEISLYFKKVKDELLSDPGDELKKVIEFKENIVSNKTVLYQEFSDVSEIEKYVRKCISKYVNDVKEKESEIIKSKNEKPDTPTGTGGEVAQARNVSSPLSPEGFHYLEEFMEKIQDDESLENITACDIARFRLLSNTVSKSGNNERALGVHDLNLLFKNKEQLDFGQREVNGLMKFGLQNISNENTPFWHWYSKDQEAINIDLYSAFGENDSEKIGALHVMNWLDIKIPKQEGRKNEIIKLEWFSEKTNSDVRNAALDYLSNNGLLSDFDLIKKEYDRSDSNTAQKSLEGMIQITSRLQGEVEAAKMVLGYQFDAIRKDILTIALKGFDQLNVTDLLLGIEHRNSKVRLKSFRMLEIKKAVTEDILEKCKKDDDAEIRQKALHIMLQNGKLLSDSEVKNILVRPLKSSNTIGFGLISNTDETGEEKYKDYKYSVSKKLSERHLKEKLSQELLVYNEEYILLYDKYFSKYSDELRSNIDNKFEKYFKQKISQLESYNIDGVLNETIKKTNELEGHFRKLLTRDALNLLCKKKKKVDLERIRKLLKEGFVQLSLHDVDYFRKYGEWSDIQLLADSYKIKGAARSLMLEYDGDFLAEISSVIYKIGRSDITLLFSNKLPNSIIIQILSICSDAVFRGVTDQVLFVLLNNESTLIRKKASICCVRAFSLKRIKLVLESYLSNDKYRYYNVIYWLDMGVSVPRKDIKCLINNIRV